MNIRSTFYAALLLVTVVIAACSSEDKKTSQVSARAQAAPKSDNPFKFYKNIEIRPGLSFEAVAWGRGADTVGGYSVYLTDTLHRNYKSISGERKGLLTGFWNLDLDTDGNPEIYLQFTKNKNESDLLVYEFDDNEFRKISFPPLSSKTRSMYLGNDKFTVRNGDLFRSIPVKGDNGAGNSEMKVQYVLQGNSFSVKDAE
ncbi:MAG: hypothetical protein EOO02_19480 [Chitinophagaceae bacterium]|nr:MAG: hypothetical protein EOO02_19480 [Chitinophagaceae bacterium]